MKTAPILAFAGYFLDARQRLLIGPDGRPVHISSRAFETLYFLASHPHELIDRHRMIEAVWPNSVVEENNLSQQISALRKLLGETAGHHRFIVTETGRGYRFVQDVQQLDSLPTHDVRDVSFPRRWRTSRTAAVAGAVVLPLVAGAAYLLLAGRESPPVATETPSARVAAPDGGTRNVEAYEAYLAARALTHNDGSGRAREAIGLLERAVQLDPDFALAWAALAESYTFAVDFAPPDALPLTPLELHQRTSRAALRAFELAPDAPQTWRSAGMVSMQNRDWAEAERRLRRAVELAGPYDYDANFSYAWFLTNVGRASEAIPYEERAMRAAPLLMRPVAFLAALHQMRGELDEAQTVLLASTNRKGHEAMLRNELIMIHMARHDRSGLRRLMPEKDCDTLDNPPVALADLRKRYAAATHSGAHAQLIPVALFASFLGDHALSLDALRALGPTQHLHAMWRPGLSEVRQLPGFAAIVEDLGLADYWRMGGHWGEFCRETGSGGLTCR